MALTQIRYLIIDTTSFFSTLSPEKQETLWWMALLAITTLMMCAPAFVILLKRFESASRTWLDRRRHRF
jgi:hypothetical protein